MMPNDNADQSSPGGGATTPWWEDLSAQSDRDEVREEINRFIREGKVRVRP
jgi:hypothetical protein